MAMSINEFLAEVGLGWDIVVRLSGSDDHPIETVTLEKKKDPSKSLAVTAQDGNVSEAQILQTVAFLRDRVDIKRPGSLLTLLLNSLPSTTSEVSPPRGIHFETNPDGSSTILDGRGAELGMIDANISIAQFSDAVVGAMGTMAANGLIGKESKFLTAASAEMRDSAIIASEDVDDLVAALNEMPAESRPVSLPEDAKAIAALKAARASELQVTLHSAVNQAMVVKYRLGEILKATDFKNVLEKNGYSIRFNVEANSDRAPSGYTVFDSDRNFFASGSFETSGDMAYLTLKGTEHFLEQADRRAELKQFLLKQALRDAAPDAIASLERSQEAISEYKVLVGEDEDREHESRSGDPDAKSEGNNNNADPSGDGR